MSKVLKIEIRRPLRGFAHYWTVMKQLSSEHGEFTVADVEAQSNGGGPNDVWDYLKRLTLAGLAEKTGAMREGAGPGARAVVWRLKRTHGPAPRLRRDGTEIPLDGQQRLWIAMRSLGVFSVAELAYAATLDAPVPPNTAASYVRRLQAAGYLVRQGDCYRLKPSMNTGPEAPKILRTHTVWDPNRRALMGQATTDEVSS